MNVTASQFFFQSFDIRIFQIGKEMLERVLWDGHETICEGVVLQGLCRSEDGSSGSLITSRMGSGHSFDHQQAAA